MINKTELKRLSQSKIRRLFTLSLVSIFGLIAFFIGLIVGLTNESIAIFVISICLLFFVVGVYFEENIVRSFMQLINKMKTRPSEEEHEDNLWTNQAKMVLAQSILMGNPDITNIELEIWVDGLLWEIDEHLSAGESVAFVKPKPDGTLSHVVTEIINVLM